MRIHKYIYTYKTYIHTYLHTYKHTHAYLYTYSWVIMLYYSYVKYMLFLLSLNTWFQFSTSKFTFSCMQNNSDVTATTLSAPAYVSIYNFPVSF